MELRQLRYFISVANHRSFTKTSEKLYIAQPALSRHILLLEEELGVKLLLRTPRGVETTEAGRIFKEKAEFALSYLAEIKNSLSETSSEPTGRLVVGLPPSLAAQLAPRLMQECARRYPRLKLHIVEGLSVFLTEWLDHLRIDIAALTDYGAIPGIDFHTELEEDLYFVGTPERLGRKSGTVSPAEVERHPMIITHGFKMLAESWFAGKDIDPNFVMELDSIGIVREMLLGGAYCSIMPFSMVHQDVAQGRLVALKFEEPRVIRRIVTGMKTNRARSVSLLAVEALIQEEIARLPQAPPPEA